MSEKQNMGSVIGGNKARKTPLAGKEHCKYLLYDFKKFFKKKEGVLQKGQAYYELFLITGIKLIKK